MLITWSLTAKSSSGFSLIGGFFLDLQALKGPELADALWEKAAVVQCLFMSPPVSPVAWLPHNILDSKRRSGF